MERQSYAALQGILKHFSKGVPLDLDAKAAAVPATIVKQVLWMNVSPHIDAAYTICDNDNVAALQLVMKDGKELVIKGWPAQRVTANHAQVVAEANAAQTFPWHPLMATMLASSKDSEGNVCSVQPYAGISLADVIRHPGWAKVSRQDKMAVFVHMASCLLKVQKAMQDEPSGPRLFRDTKPDNIVYNHVSNMWSYIDFGLMCRLTGEDYFPALSLCHVTPEFAAPVGYPHLLSHLHIPRLFQAATNATTDVYLMAYVGMCMLDGTPAELHLGTYNMGSDKGIAAYLKAVHTYCFEERLSYLPRGARDFFTACLCKNPQQRLTPEQALQHPFLAGTAAAVEAAVAAARPGYCQANQQALELFSGLGKEVFVAHQARLTTDAWGAAYTSERESWGGEDWQQREAAADEAEEAVACHPAEKQQLLTELQAAQQLNSEQAQQTQQLKLAAQQHISKQAQEIQQLKLGAQQLIRDQAQQAQQAQQLQLAAQQHISEQAQEIQQLKLAAQQLIRDQAQQAQQAQQLQLAATADRTAAAAAAAAALASALQQLQALQHTYDQQGQELQCVQQLLKDQEGRQVDMQCVSEAPVCQQQADVDNSVAESETPLCSSSSGNSSSGSSSSTSSSSTPTCSVPAATNPSQQQQQPPPAMPAAAAPAAMPFTAPLAAENQKTLNLLQRGVQLVKQLASSSSSSKQAKKSKPAKAAGAAASTAHSTAAPSGCATRHALFLACVASDSFAGAAGSRDKQSRRLPSPS